MRSSTAPKTADLQEAFGTGTAAVVSPVGQFTYRDRTVSLKAAKPES